MSTSAGICPEGVKAKSKSIPKSRHQDTVLLFPELEGKAFPETPSLHSRPVCVLDCIIVTQREAEGKH